MVNIFPPLQCEGTLFIKFIIDSLVRPIKRRDLFIEIYFFSQNMNSQSLLKWSCVSLQFFTLCIFLEEQIELDMNNLVSFSLIFIYQNKYKHKPSEDNLCSTFVKEREY